MSNYETLSICCKDGYVLGGRFYQTLEKTQKRPVLICPATGITQQFYHHFATWLTEQGYATMVFDFRGIGASLHGPLKHSTASIVQWGNLDIPAAVQALCAKTHTTQVILLGHSAGGQLLGINPDYEKVAQVIAVAGSTGYIKHLKGRTKQLAPIMFKGLFPLGRYTLGYGPTRAIGMGENLPKDVARDWALFCSQPGYVVNALGRTVHQDFHPQIRCPITAIWASDDEIATEANVHDLLRLYPNASTTHIELKPHLYGHKSIGHMAMFKRSHQNLWPEIAAQLLG